MITQELLKHLMHYNPETGVFTRLITTNPRAKAGTIAGTKTSDGYLTVQIEGQPYRLHRLAFLYMTGELPPDELVVDHINQVRHDNRFFNLRIGTHAENLQNVRGANDWLNRTSKHRGVHWDSKRGKWFAQIAVNGKKRFLGRFESEEAALLAYESARDELHPFRPLDAANNNKKGLSAAAA